MKKLRIDSDLAAAIATAIIGLLLLILASKEF